MKNHIYRITLLAFALLAISCQQKYKESWEGLNFDSDEYTINYDAEKIAITVWCTGPWTAQLKEGSDWLELLETSGSGTSTIHCTFEKNLGLSRRGVLLVEGCGVSKEITLIHNAGIALPQIVMLSSSMTVPTGTYRIEGSFGTNIPNQYLTDDNLRFDFGIADPWITDGVILAREDTLQRSSIPNGRKKFFNATVAANQGSQRDAKVIIFMKDAAGIEYKDSMSVIQTGEAPYINNPSPDVLNLSGGTREVALVTNLTAMTSDFALTVEYPEGQSARDFVSDCSMNGRNLTYAVAPNAEAGGKRYATIKISYTDLAGTKTEAQLQIEQTDMPESFDNFEIKSLEHLMMWNRSYSSWKATDRITLGTDIDMTSISDWTPHEFQGTFIGGGHKIYNVSLSGGSSDNRFGFFSKLSGEASVSNLVIGSSDGANYDGKSVLTINENPSSATYVGVLAGQIAGNACVESIKNFVYVSLDCQPAGIAYIGGIVGDYSSTRDLKNCANYGKITSRISAVGTYNVDIGGIFAQNLASDIEVYRCSNYGNIEVACSQACVNTVNYGGVAAYTNKALKFTECTNAGDIRIAPGSKSYDNKDTNVGGILGYANGASSVAPSFNGCINSGNITNYGGATGNAICIGGIVGKDNAAIGISNCSNSGNITQGEAIDDVTARQIYIGGIVGKDFDNTPGSVSYCVNSGNIVVNSKCINEGYTGGIAGSMMKSGTSIDHSENNGKLTKNGTGAYSYSGGIVGAQQIAGGNITNCKNTADVVNNGPVTGSLRFGGIVGQVCAITIDNCTVTGSVLNTSTAITGTANISAVAGHNNGTACTLSNCTVTGGSVSSASSANYLSAIVTTNVASVMVTGNKVGGGLSVGGTVLTAGNYNNLLVAGGQAGSAVKSDNTFID